MTAKIKCCDCEYMKMAGRANRTGNNFGLKGPRGSCFCEHTKARETFELICPRSPRMAGFIGYTVPGGDVPTIRTSPRWCPLKYGE